MKLEQLQSLKSSDINLLHSYSVVTVEQFLGISFGLSQRSVLSLLSNEDAVVTEIQLLFSVAELESFRMGYTLPAMGELGGEHE